VKTGLVKITYIIIRVENKGYFMKLKVTNFNALHVFCCYIMIDLLLYLGTNIFGHVYLAIRHVCP